jgi:hypothetical protein
LSAGEAAGGSLCHLGRPPAGPPSWTRYSPLEDPQICDFGDYFCSELIKVNDLVQLGS